jgi:hypothetical protein
LASFFEVAFVNSLGLPFFSGTIFFFVLLIVGCVWLIRYARKKNNALVYNATMGLIFLLIGYGSFAVIVIRSNANPPLDENDPENLVTLHSYLKREQYGSAPILFGPQWNSKENPQENYKDRSPFYLRRFIVSKGDKVLKAFKDENRALAFAKENAVKSISKINIEHGICHSTSLGEYILRLGFRLLPIQVFKRISLSNKFILWVYKSLNLDKNLLIFSFTSSCG